MKTMLIVSPLMIVFMSLSAPAGVTLYWVVGGVFSCLQTFITNVIMKPKIRAQVEAEMKANPQNGRDASERCHSYAADAAYNAKKKLNHKKMQKGRNAGQNNKRKNKI